MPSIPNHLLTGLQEHLRRLRQTKDASQNIGPGTARAWLAEFKAAAQRYGPAVWAETGTDKDELRGHLRRIRVITLQAHVRNLRTGRCRQYAAKFAKKIILQGIADGISWEEIGLLGSETELNQLVENAKHYV